MEQAIGSKIADYLIKPVNPNQILLTLKKNIHHKEIVAEKANSAYQQNFGKIITLPTVFTPKKGAPPIANAPWWDQ